MNIEKIFSSLLFFFLALVQTAGWSAIPVNAPDPDVWYDEILASKVSNSLNPLTYVVVEKIAKRYEFVRPELNTRAFFANPASVDVAAFTKDVSQKLPSGGCTASPTNFSFCLGAQYALDVSSTKWKLFTIDQEGKSQMVYSGNGSPKRNYAEWIQAQLGFDGVVLATKDGFFLAQVPETSIPGETQVLAIKNSVDRLYLGAGKGQGAGLLAVAKRKGKLATLSTIITDSANASGWRPGMKIIIEKSKKKN